MKPNASRPPYTSKLILFGVIAAVATAAGCSKSRSTESYNPIASPAHEAHLQTVSAPVVPPKPSVETTSVATKRVPVQAKPPASKLLTYRSRDYGISFEYPWQYAFVSAKSISQSDATAASTADDAQVVLARIEVPKGFYPDTDFEAGSFTVTLKDVDEQTCYSKLGAPADVRTDTINTIPFRWAETDEGGHGKAVKQRTYATFTNDTCYQLHAIVKTSNEGGTAREIDPDLVLRRLDAMAKSVKIAVVKPETTPAEPAPAPVAASASTSQN
jgi:hypothetical protein